MLGFETQAPWHPVLVASVTVPQEIFTGTVTTAGLSFSTSAHVYHTSACNIWYSCVSLCNMRSHCPPSPSTTVPLVREEIADHIVVGPPGICHTLMDLCFVRSFSGSFVLASELNIIRTRARQWLCIFLVKDQVVQCDSDPATCARRSAP